MMPINSLNYMFVASLKTTSHFHSSKVIAVQKLRKENHIHIMPGHTVKAACKTKSNRKHEICPVGF